MRARHCQHVGWGVVLVLAAVGAPRGWAQQDASERVLRSDWRNLPAGELRVELEKLESIMPGASTALGEPLAERVKALLTSGVDVSLDAQATLAEAGQPYLSAQDETQILAQVQAQPVDPSALAFDQLSDRYELLESLDAVPADTSQLVRSWLASRDAQQLSVEQLAWLAPRTYAAGLRSPAIEVRWQGSVTAPADGQYTFSVSPINAANLRSVFHYARQSLTVKVGDELVLETASDAWSPLGKPVSLRGGVKTPIEVTLAYAHLWAGKDEYPPVAMLFWEGPALPQQLVPSSALTPPAGAGQGLAAQYVGGDQRQQTIDARIAFRWPIGRTIAAADSAESQQLTELLWSKATDPGYLDQLSGQRAQVHPLLAQATELAEVLSSERQAAWLSLVKERPALMAPLALPQAQAVYGAYRFSAPDDALDVLGQWMLAHAESLPQFTHTWAETNRHPYHRLADMMTFEYDPHSRLLEDRYLTTLEGECCLPSASTLAFIYCARGNWRQWADLLESLATAAPANSDSRARWLIARAMAEEVRYTGRDRYEAASVFPLLGERFLREALEAAVSEPVKLRAYGELVVRFAAVRDFDYAEQLASEAAAALRSPASSNEIARWQAEIRRLRQAFQLDLEIQEMFRQVNYRKSIEEYLQKARQHEDQRSIELYEDLLQRIP